MSDPTTDDPMTERSTDDTDIGWGDEAPADAEEDLRRYAEDRPPHWEP